RRRGAQVRDLLRPSRVLVLALLRLVASERKAHRVIQVLRLARERRILDGELHGRLSRLVPRRAFSSTRGAGRRLAACSWLLLSLDPGIRTAALRTITAEKTSKAPGSRHFPSPAAVRRSPASHFRSRTERGI